MYHLSREQVIQYSLLFGGIPKEEVNPFELVSIDIVGPLKTSINNHRYVLTMIDCASRWAEAVPLTNIRAATVCEALTRTWIHRFGPPRYFLSDCGTRFTSAMFQELAHKFNFRHKHTTISHPQGNSIVQRFHREIKDSLRCLPGLRAILCKRQFSIVIARILLTLRQFPLFNTFLVAQSLPSSSGPIILSFVSTLVSVLG